MTDIGSVCVSLTWVLIKNRYPSELTMPNGELKMYRQEPCDSGVFAERGHESLPIKIYPITYGRTT